MSCRITETGVALFAAFLASLLMVPGASAASFHSDAEATLLVAGQVEEHEQGFDLGVIVCEVVHFTGEQLEQTTEELVLSPLYTRCEFSGLWELTINLNGCDYVYTASSETEGSRAIAGCGTNKYIQFGSLSTCRVRIPEQSGNGAVHYQNVGNSIEFNTELVNIEYTEAGIFCAGTGGVNGTYYGISEMYGNEEAAKLWVG